MSYMNIPYGLEAHTDLPLCRFKSIWKVQANETYQVSKSHGFDAPGLFITIEGEGLLTQAAERHVLHAGTCMFVQEGIASAYRCRHTDWKFYFLDFSHLDMARFLQLPVGEVITTGKLPGAIRLCEQLIENLIEQPAGYAYSANLLLHEILLLLAREQSAAASTRHTELNKVLLYMHQHMNKPIRIEELVQLSGLSRTTFFTLFRTVTGLSPSEYWLKLKLESAKSYLETTNLAVKEIAAKLQFYDEFHFSKLFKRRYGQSPSAFRRQNDALQQPPRLLT